MEEFIDYLRITYPSGQFKTHFTTWLPIIKKISEKFISRDPNHPFTYWANRIADEHNIGVYSRSTCYTCLGQLSDSCNYFILVEPFKKIMLYEATPHVIPVLLSGIRGSFYVVDKKYNWLTCFSPDGNGNYLVRKSGSITTPVEELLF